MSRCPHCGKGHNASNHFCPISGNAIDLGPRLMGLTLLDHFKVVAFLGEGPIGAVLEVEDLQTGNRLAAKIIHPRYTNSPGIADKILKEAKVAGALKCPHIATVVKVGQDTGGAPVVIRELLAGYSLEEYLEQNKEIPLEEATDITRDILVALAEVHSSGIVNMDLSPSDVYLDESSGKRIIKIVDLGEGNIKPLIESAKGESPASHAYYAPELVNNPSGKDLRSDIYAAAAIMYHLCTGKAPVQIPKPANSIRKDMNPQLASAIHKALAASPDHRYQSAAEFIGALDQAVLTASVSQPPPQPSPVEVPKTSELSVIVDEAENKTVAKRSRSAADIKQELEQPSVIVDMPEVHKKQPKNMVILIAVGAVVVFGIIALLYQFVFSSSAPEKSKVEMVSDEIIITISAFPSDAILIIDGEKVKGNPYSITTNADSKMHTLKAKSKGYETLEKDVRFDKTKSVDLVLAEIIEPDGVKSGKESAEGIDTADGEPLNERSSPGDSIRKKNRKQVIKNRNRKKRKKQNEPKKGGLNVSNPYN